MNFRDEFSLISEESKFNDIYGRLRTYSVNKDFHNPTLSNKLFENGFRPVYPDDKQFCVLISHDVDFVFEKLSIKDLVMQELKNLITLRLRSFVQILNQNFFRKEVRDWSLKKFIVQEKQLSINSTYFFLNLSKKNQDFNYFLHEMHGYMCEILSDGSEVAFHGGHEAYCDKTALFEQFDGFLKLQNNNSKVGYRNHYLRFDNKCTFNLLEEFEFDYDATLGMADNVGFRNGMCYPFRPICQISGEFLNILEIPLNVMDVNFFKYMGLSLDDSFSLFKEIYEKVKRVNGVFSILWHNNNLQGDYGILYDKIIDFITADNDAWITTHREVARHWRKNNLEQMENILLNNFFSNESDK